MSLLKTTALVEELPKWQKEDTIWVLSLYGTAIGAGVLFLPINVGLAGIWPLVFMALLAFPMTYFSHRALCRFVLSGATVKHDLTAVVEEHFGNLGGKFLTFLYCFSIYPVLLMYCVALTNTTQNFLVNQLNLTAWPRSILAYVIVFGLMIVVRTGQQAILRSLSFLVYPFIACLILISLYLIPYWNSSLLQYQPAENSTIFMAIWLVIPVMIFSFNHTAIISAFALTQKNTYGRLAEQKCSGILKYSHILMVLTVVFFVFSCVLSLSPEDLILAKKQNITILSYIANHLNITFISYLAPIIAFIAIVKAFFGHYLGAREGIRGLAVKFSTKARKTDSKKMLYLIDIFIFISCWLIATLNPSVLGMIELLGGPFIAIILFLMPMYAIKTVPVLKKYYNSIQVFFIGLMGIMAISALLYNFFVPIFSWFDIL